LLFSPKVGSQLEEVIAESEIENSSLDLKLYFEMTEEDIEKCHSFYSEVGEKQDESGAQRKVLTKEQLELLLRDKNIAKIIVYGKENTPIGFIVLGDLEYISDMKFENGNLANASSTGWTDTSGFLDHLKLETKVNGFDNLEQKGKRKFRSIFDKRRLGLKATSDCVIEEVTEALNTEDKLTYVFGNWGWFSNEGDKTKTWDRLKANKKLLKLPSKLILSESTDKRWLSRSPVDCWLVAQQDYFVIPSTLLKLYPGAINFEVDLNGDFSENPITLSDDYTAQLLSSSDSKIEILEEIWQLHEEEFEHLRKNTLTIQDQSQTFEEFKEVVNHSSSMIGLIRDGNDEITSFWIGFKDLQKVFDDMIYSGGGHSVNLNLVKKYPKLLYTFTTASRRSGNVRNNLFRVLAGFAKSGYSTGGDTSVNTGASISIISKIQNIPTVQISNHMWHITTL